MEMDTTQQMRLAQQDLLGLNITELRAYGVSDSASQRRCPTGPVNSGSS
jgi:hypothetical protein